MTRIAATAHSAKLHGIDYQTAAFAWPTNMDGILAFELVDWLIEYEQVEFISCTTENIVHWMFMNLRCDVVWYVLNFTWDIWNYVMQQFAYVSLSISDFTLSRY